MPEDWKPAEGRDRDPLRVVLEGGGIGVAYLAAGLVGSGLVAGDLPLLAPAAGVALAGLLLYGVVYWPAVGVSATVLALVAGAPLWTAALVGAASTLSAVAGALLLRRGAGFHLRMDRVRDVMAFSVLGVAASPAIAAILGSAALAAGGAIASGDLARTILAWWLSDGTGVLVVAPLVFAIGGEPVREGWPRTWPVEATLGLTLALLLAVLLFGPRVPVELSQVALLLPLPLVVWGSFRLGLLGAAGAVAVLTLVGAWRTAAGVGPLAVAFPSAGSPPFWAYALTMGVSALLIWALVGEHRGSLRLLRAVFEGSSDGVLVFRDGRVIDCNAAAGRLFGARGREKLLGTPLTELSPKSQPGGASSREGFGRHLRDVEEGGAERFEWLHQRLDGTTFPAEIALSALFVDGHPGHVAVVRDRTQQKAYEEELTRAREEADAANAAKTEYLLSVSHEIRSALNANLGFSRLLARDDALPARTRDHAERIHRSALHLLDLVNDVLEVSRVEVGRLALSTTDFDPRAMVRELESTFRQRADDKGISLDVRVDPDLPAFVRTDHAKLRQILVNVLGNAVKFTSRGVVSVRVSRAEAAVPGRVRLAFEVADSGPGIPPEELERIFRPAGAGGRRGVATVLGLAGSVELARMLGGQLHAVASGGEGSRLSLEVEVEEGKEVEAGEAAPRRVSGLEGGQEPPRILVVDDREENRTLLISLLARVGFEVREARDGNEAVHLFGEWSPHLLLMNRQMPGMDGLEATRRIRVTEEGGDTPIVVVSASGSEGDQDEIRSSGADGIVGLPFDEAEVLREVQRHLGVRYAYEETGESA